MQKILAHAIWYSDDIINCTLLNEIPGMPSFPSFLHALHARIPSFLFILFSINPFILRVEFLSPGGLFMAFRLSSPAFCLITMISLVSSQLKLFQGLCRYVLEHQPLFKIDCPKQSKPIYLGDAPLFNIGNQSLAHLPEI